MNKILVTGGAGFIGSALVNRFLFEGHDVYVVDDLSFGNRKFISSLPHDHFFNLSILEAEALKKCLQQVNPDCVVHLAAVHFIPFCNEHPFLASNINIQGSINLLNACLPLKKLTKVFFASTAAIYPIIDGAIHEEIEPGATDIYGLSKVAGERLFHEFYLRTGIPTVVCRFFNAFGPNETNPHLIPVIQQQINDGARTLRLGNLEPKRDYIHTADMAEAVTMLLRKFDHGYDVFNLGSGEEFSVVDIVKSFESELGEELTIVQDSERVRKSDRMHLKANITKLTNFISWKPSISIDAGIRTLILNKVAL